MSYFQRAQIERENYFSQKHPSSIHLQHSIGLTSGKHLICKLVLQFAIAEYVCERTFVYLDYVLNIVRKQIDYT